MCSGNKAWVTLATNDTYSLGALVLAYSLRKVNTVHSLAVMITPGVTESMRKLLRDVFNEVHEVDILDSNDEANLRLLKRPELGITFTKLHCWKLIQFEKCVFLDADTLVLKNCEELFDREELSAAPDVGWPDCFNSGVFVYRPNIETYNKLIEFALAHGSFDGGDQGLLNMFFSDWAHSDIRKHLPFVYNMCSAAIYSYIPAFKWFGKDVKIIHFIGGAKPWLQSFNPFNRTVDAANDLPHLKGLLQLWWDVFCSNVHPSLSTDMTEHRLRSWYDSNELPPENYFPSLPVIPSVFSCFYTFDPEPEDYYTFTDPWEENFELPDNVTDENIYEKCQLDKNLETDLESEIFFSPLPVHSNPNSKNDTFDELQHVQNNLTEHCNININNNKFNNVLCSFTYPFSPSCSDTEEFRENFDLHYFDDEKSGLASSFSQMKLDESSLEVQQEIQDNLRRQNWEQGNIDYCGKDSFDNILAKINKTLDSQKSTENASTVPQSQATESIIIGDSTVVGSDSTKFKQVQIYHEPMILPTSEKTETPESKCPVETTKITQSEKSETPESKCPAETTKIIQSEKSETPESKCPAETTKIIQSEKSETPESKCPAETTKIIQSEKSETPESKCPAETTKIIQSEKSETPESKCPAESTKIIQSPIPPESILESSSVAPAPESSPQSLDTRSLSATQIQTPTSCAKTAQENPSKVTESSADEQNAKPAVEEQTACQSIQPEEKNLEQPLSDKPEKMKPQKSLSSEGKK